MKTLLAVKADNSSVNGRPARARHDARIYFDGWMNLGINDSRTYKDGKELWEYLHVPVLRDEEDRWYRVYCRFRPGMRFAGGIVKAVTVVYKSGWFWQVHSQQRKPLTPKALRS